MLTLVDLVLVNHKALEEELRDEVEEHVDGQNEVWIPKESLGCEMLEPSGGRRENCIVESHESHSARNIRVGLEGEAAVEGEIPKHRKHEGEEVTEPMLEMKKFFKKGETEGLNDARRSRKKNEFECTKSLFFIDSCHVYTCKSFEIWLQRYCFFMNYANKFGSIEKFSYLCTFFDETDASDKEHIKQVGIAAASAGGDGAWCVAEFLHARLVRTWLCDV